MSSIPTLLAELYAARCAEQDIPGGATRISWAPPIIVVVSGKVEIEDVIRCRPGGIIRVQSLDAIQFPVGTWMSHPEAWDLHLWDPARGPIPQKSKPTYGQNTPRGDISPERPE